MSPNVNALSIAAEHSEKGKSRGHRQPSAPPAYGAAAAPRQPEAAEQTDRAKNRRRGTDRDVGRAMDKCVGKITARAGQQDESATKPRTHHAGYGAEK